MTHTKIFDQPIEEQIVFKQNLIRIAKNVSNDTINELLININWRNSLVGAWLAFVNNQSDLLNSIGELLLKGKAGTVGYCYALAKFHTVESSYYLLTYLERELYFEKFPNERFQDIALYALMYIDKQNKTEFANELLKPNGLWNKFVDYEFMTSFKLSNSNRWNNILDHYNDFEKMLEFINAVSESKIQ
nr:hypothetical protein [Flavobacterium sp. MC2016-06]